jgi:hypothetical protein
VSAQNCKKKSQKEADVLDGTGISSGDSVALEQLLAPLHEQPCLRQLSRCYFLTSSNIPIGCHDVPRALGSYRITLA